MANPTVGELQAQLEKERAEHDELSMEMALAVSEFLMVMQKLTEGDYTVRAPEDSKNEVLARMGMVINKTIEKLHSESTQMEEAHKKLSDHASELEKSLERIRRQQSAIAEMSTPIIQVWDKIICLPVVGIVDSRRAAEMMDTLLTRIVATESRCVIVDITGVEVVDTQTADHFIKMIRAASLLGVTCMITGIRPQIAQTITQIGIELGGIRTLRNLEAGLIESMLLLGLKVVSRG